MSEPTLKDVLTAIARLEKGQAETHERLDELRDDVEVIRRLLVPTRQGVSDLRDKASQSPFCWMQRSWSSDAA